MKIESNLKTKLTLPKEKLSKGQKLTKRPSERFQFKKEISLYKARKYKNSELAEFYWVTENTIEKALTEIRREWLKIYEKNKIGLVEDQVLEIDILLEEAYADLDSIQDVETKIKLRKEIKDSLAYKAKIQWLLVDNVNVNNVWNPSIELLQQFNVFKPDNNASNT